MRRALLFLLSLLCLPAWAEPVSEYDMKAAYLYNFALFTNWPSSSEEQFNLCLLGGDNFGTALRKIEGKSIHGKPLTIARLSSYSAIHKCHLLFVTEREAANLARISAILGNSAVLTVTDMPVTQQAAITMYIENQRLVFDVNHTAARRQGVELSAKLLRLARSLTP